MAELTQLREMMREFCAARTRPPSSSPQQESVLAEMMRQQGEMTRLLLGALTKSPEPPPNLPDPMKAALELLAALRQLAPPPAPLPAASDPMKAALELLVAFQQLAPAPAPAPTLAERLAEHKALREFAVPCTPSSPASELAEIKDLIGSVMSADTLRKAVPAAEPDHAEPSTRREARLCRVPDVGLVRVVEPEPGAYPAPRLAEVRPAEMREQIRRDPALREKVLRELGLDGLLVPASPEAPALLPAPVAGADTSEGSPRASAFDGPRPTHPGSPSEASGIGDAPAPMSSTVSVPSAQAASMSSPRRSTVEAPAGRVGDPVADLRADDGPRAEASLVPVAPSPTHKASHAEVSPQLTSAGSASGSGPAAPPKALELPERLPVVAQQPSSPEEVGRARTMLQQLAAMPDAERRRGFASVPGLDTGMAGDLALAMLDVPAYAWPMVIQRVPADVVRALAGALGNEAVTSRVARTSSSLDSLSAGREA